MLCGESRLEIANPGNAPCIWAASGPVPEEPTTERLPRYSAHVSLDVARKR